jgi:hypothetical protein
MTDRKKEREKLPAHKIAAMLIEQDPQAHVITLTEMYKRGAVVPAQDIPGLIAAFEKAKEKMKFLTFAARWREFIDEAITALRDQLEEVKKEEKGKKEGS